MLSQSDYMSLLAKQLEEELWHRGDIQDLLLHEGQLKVYNKIQELPSDVKEVCLKMSRRYGKSYLAVVIAFITCLKKPNAQVIIAAPTQKQAYNITVPLIRQIANKAPKKLLKQLKSELRWQFSNGSQLVLGGFDSASESFRGLAADLVIVEEGGATQPDNFLYTTSSILLPVLLSTGGRMIHVYTPAPTPDHPLHTVTEARANLKDALYTYDIHSCPLYTKQQVQEMCEAVGGEHSLAWKREFLVLPERDTEKTCVPEFQENLHVRPLTAPAHTKYWIASDIGGTLDPSAFLLMAHDYHKDQTQVLAEAHLPPNPSNPTIVKLVDQLKSLASVPKDQIPVYMDAPGSLRSDLLQTYNLQLSTLTKSPTKYGIHEKLSHIRQAIANDKIAIDPSCKMLITTLRSAQLNSARTDYQRTDLIGHADHLDALIYGYRHRVTQVVLPRSKDPDVAIVQELEEMDRKAIQQESLEWWQQ